MSKEHVTDLWVCSCDERAYNRLGAPCQYCGDPCSGIVLRCPLCKSETAIERESFDPPLAMVAQRLCPGCVDITNAHEPGTSYFDENENQVYPEGYDPER